MKKLLLSFVTAGAVLACAHASAQIIQDNLGGGGTFSGRTPVPTDQPGSTWVLPFDYGYGEGLGVTTGPTNYGYMRGDSQAVISVASSGTYVEPPILNISSANIQYGSIGDGSDPGRGVALGFYANDTATESISGGLDNAGSGHAFSDFSGLVLNGNGALSLFDDGVYTGTSSTYDGTFTGGGSLSYDYNTLTGDITNVIFNGVDYSSYFAGDEVQTGDTFAGWSVSSDSGGGTGYLFTNFVVAAPAVIPEPGTDALFALGGCLVLAGWLRLRRSKA